jgi:DNA transformation protein and related proteins
MDPEFIRDLFVPFGPVVVRRMFGGAGLFREGLMFGLEFDGTLFLRVDEHSIPDFEREGSRPFVYTRAKSPGKVGRDSTSYWRLPERLYDDPEELVVWAERAFAIAQRKKTTSRARIRAKQPKRSATKAPKPSQRARGRPAAAKSRSK